MNAPSPPYRVLFVDDDDAMRRAITLLLAHTLGSQGYFVQGAESADEARALLAAARIDVLLLDLMLPKETGGHGDALLAELRAAGDPIGVVVVTGVGPGPRVDRVLDMRPDALLFKPVHLPDLVAAVLEAQGKSAARRVAVAAGTP